MQIEGRYFSIKLRNNPLQLLTVAWAARYVLNRDAAIRPQCSLVHLLGRSRMPDGISISVVLATIEPWPDLANCLAVLEPKQVPATAS